MCWVIFWQLTHFKVQQVRNDSEMMKDEEIHVYKTLICVYCAAEISTQVSMLTS